MSDITRHTIDISKRNTNYREKAESQRAKLDFCGVYPANYERPAIACIDIQLTDYYEKTSRTLYGTANLSKEETIALRDQLNEIIDSENWGEQLTK